MHGLNPKLLHLLTKSPSPYPSITIIGKPFSKSLHSRKDSYYYTRLLRCPQSNPKTLNQIHTQIVVAGLSINPFLTSNLISRYADTGNVGFARNLFDQIPTRDVDAFLCNVMIRAYANAGPQTEAVYLYNDMRRLHVQSNCYTYPFLFKACACIADARIGGAIHAHTVINGLESNVFVGNALLAFYAKCKEIGISRKLFDTLAEKDLVSWNSMIAGYAQNDFSEEAVEIFRKMLRNDFCGPDRVTLVAVLPACVALSAVNEGLWVHSYAIKMGMGQDSGLACGLIGMYANCGRLDLARALFDRITERNLVLCNAMMHAYGTHGRAEEAFEVFSEMLAMCIEPDDIYFVCMLSACSHAGLIDRGFEMFEMMDSYKIQKRQVHYACIVDMLGRAGQLQSAIRFIEDMPLEPDKDVWGALLGAARVWKDVALAELAAERLFVLDPENAGRYMALANMYEDVGRAEDAARVRKAMRDRGVRKPLGCSSVEMGTKVHTFGVKDELHPMTDEIYDVLGLLQGMVEEDGGQSAGF